MNLKLKVILPAKLSIPSCPDETHDVTVDPLEKTSRKII